MGATAVVPDAQRVHRGESESGERKEDACSDLREAGEASARQQAVCPPCRGVQWRELGLSEPLLPRTRADSRMGSVTFGPQ